MRVDLSVGALPTSTVATPALSLPGRPGKIQCYSPATMQYLGEVNVTSGKEVESIVMTARSAQQIWAKTSWHERRRVLRMMKDAVLAHADEIIRLSCIDTGKTRVDAQFGEILSTLGKLDWVISEGEAVLAPESRPTNFMTYTMAKRAHVAYVPLGVLGVIAPWNYPFYNLYNHIASGLFAGNAVVLKMSEYSAWSGDKYIRLARECLAAAGHNPDLVQLVQGFGETGAALVAHTDKVIFTGSPGVGKLVMAGASKTLTPLVLELGGKDPLVVTEDANLAAVVPVACRGTYQNAGQNCVGIERVYVYESVYDAFVSAAVAQTSTIRVGPSIDPATLQPATGVDMGSITTAPQLALIQELVNDAVAKGARLHVGGRILYKGAVDGGSGGASAPTPSGKGGRGKSPARGAKAGAAAMPEAPAGTDGGLFYAPTVLSDVTHDMRIANEEVFGPVMCIFRVPRDSDEACLQMANSTAYGLGATVFCGSTSRGRALAERIRSGMVGVNSYGLNYLVQSLPFGGVGASGFDRFSGPEGLRACCLMRSIVVDAVPGLPFAMAVPPPLQYPLWPSAYSFTWGLLRMLFSESWLEKVAGLAALAKAGMIKGQ